MHASRTSQLVVLLASRNTKVVPMCSSSESWSRKRPVLFKMVGMCSSCCLLWWTPNIEIKASVRKYTLKNCECLLQPLGCVEVAFLVGCHMRDKWANTAAPSMFDHHDNPRKEENNATGHGPCKGRRKGTVMMLVTRRESPNCTTSSSSLLIVVNVGSAPPSGCWSRYTQEVRLIDLAGALGPKSMLPIVGGSAHVARRFRYRQRGIHCARHGVELKNSTCRKWWDSPPNVSRLMQHEKSIGS